MVSPPCSAISSSSFDAFSQLPPSAAIWTKISEITTHVQLAQSAWTAVAERIDGLNDSLRRWVAALYHERPPQLCVLGLRVDTQLSYESLAHMLLVGSQSAWRAARGRHALRAP